MWRESESPTGAVLSIGDPDSAMIQFRCVRPGTLRMDLAGLYTGEGPQPRRVVVESGRVRASYRLTDGADDQARFGADIPAAAPVIDALQRDGRVRARARNVTVEGGGRSSSELSLVARFFARCRG